MPKKSHISITIAGENKILSANIEFMSNNANDIHALVSEDKNTVTVDFEYLDKNDGFIIQIVHTSGYITESNIYGIIKDMGEVKSNSVEKLEERIRNWTLIMCILSLVVLVLCLVFFMDSKFRIISVIPLACIMALQIALFVVPMPPKFFRKYMKDNKWE
ncbi:MAG: hypothetical protein LBM77_08610 [Spirochaetaceae bacterium]|jgi:hypothetical protein|nr:hypothetical protein [Spirochaetaceae bacterium]